SRAPNTSLYSRPTGGGHKGWFCEGATRVCPGGESSFILKRNMPDDSIPHLSGYSEAELDQAFAAVSREVEDSAAVLATPVEVENFRLHWLGRKQGRLKAISDAWLKAAPPEAKKPLGQRFNKLKAEIEQRLE